MTRIGSLFTGVGGLDLGALAVFGGDVVWHSECDPAAVRVLDRHWPQVPNLGDVTAVDWDTVPPVDIVVGGPPCQDVSQAGKRDGLRTGNRSGLVSHMLDAVARLRPRLVILENVQGLLNAYSDGDLEPCSWCLGNSSPRGLRAFGAVLGNLASCGYDARWACVRASDVGAPHQRPRVFVVAVVGHDVTRLSGSADTNRDQVRHQPITHQGGGGAPLAGIDGNGQSLPDAASNGRGKWVAQLQGQRRQPDAGIDRLRVASHTTNGHQADGNPLDPPPCGPGWRGGREPRTGVGASAGDPAARVHLVVPGTERVDFGGYEPAIQRWEAILGRLAPAPTCMGRRGGQVLSPAFVEWMMGFTAGHVSEMDSIKRSDALRLLGNAVVPQQAEYAIRLLTPPDLIPSEVAA